MTPREIIRASAAELRPKAGRLAEDYERASPDRRDAIDDALVLLTHSVAGPYVQDGPSPEIKARLILGATLRELAPMLNASEAARWIEQSDYESPLDWLWSLVKERHTALKEASQPSTVAVVRWIDGVMNDPERRAAAMRTRQGRIGEENVEGTVLDRLDEILPEDLHSSPMRTIEAAGERLAAQQWTGPDELTEEKPWHAMLPPEVTVLRRFSDLLTEGRECRHCVAAYAHRVRSGECVIVRVLANDGTRSTAEIIRGKVHQHRGPRNGQPSPACEAIVAAIKWK